MELINLSTEVTINGEDQQQNLAMTPFSSQFDRSSLEVMVNSDSEGSDEVEEQVNLMELCERDPTYVIPLELRIKVISNLSIDHSFILGASSPAWAGLWKHTQRLELKRDDLSFKTLRQAEKLMFCQWAGFVISNLESPDIRFVSVHADLVEEQSTYINRWLEFFFQKGVTDLTLDFTGRPRHFVQSPLCLPPNPHTTYSLVLPLEVVTRSSSNLVCVRLSKVIVKQEVLEFLCYCCPFLRDLLMDGNSGIRRLSLPLKRMLNSLVIMNWDVLEYVEVHFGATLSCIQLAPGMVFTDTDFTRELTLVPSNLEKRISPTVISGILKKVSNLVFLQVGEISVTEELLTGLDLSHMRNVVEFDITLRLDGADNVNFVAAWISSMHSLQEVTLSLVGRRGTLPLHPMTPEDVSFEGFVFKTTAVRRFCFKGYFGVAADVNLLAFICSTSPMLERVELIMVRPSLRRSQDQFDAAVNVAVQQLQILRDAGFLWDEVVSVVSVVDF